MLLTSRHGDWTRTLVDSVTMDVLTTDDAVELLLSLSGSKDRVGATDLVERLGRLALTIEQAGATVGQRRWTFARYRELLDSRASEMLEMPLRGMDRTVAEVLRSSLAQAQLDSPHAAGVIGVRLPRTRLDSPLAAGGRPRRRRGPARGR